MKKIYILTLNLLLTLSIFSSSDVELVFQSDKPFTNIAVSRKNRIFLSYPKLHKGEKVYAALYELVKGELKLFPNMMWNSMDSDNSSENFVCVSDIYIDKRDRLWVLDAANPYKKGIVKTGVKIHKINLMTNLIEKTYTFGKQDLFGNSGSSVILPNSYLNKIRIDSRRNIAYISDSEQSALLVINLETNEILRALPNVNSTKGQKDKYMYNGEMTNKIVHVNGIALSPDFNWLCYAPQNSNFIYKIPTYRLRNKSLISSEMDKYVQEISQIPATSSMIFTNNWNVYFGGYKDNSINILSRSDHVITLDQSPEYQWISDLAKDKKGKVYFVTSNQNMHFKSRPDSKIFKINMNITTSSPFGEDWDITSSFYRSMNIPSSSVVFVGDRVYANVQIAEMFNRLDVKNRSIMSDRTDVVLLRVRQIAQSKPSKIFLSVGINDLESGMKPDQVINNYKQIISFIKKETSNTSIYVQSVLPVNIRKKTKSNSGFKNKSDRIIVLNDLLKKFCAEEAVTYIDLFPHFKESKTNNMNMRFSIDGVNLNDEGYRKLTSIITEYVN